MLLQTKDFLGLIREFAGGTTSLTSGPSAASKSHGRDLLVYNWWKPLSDPIDEFLEGECTQIETETLWGRCFREAPTCLRKPQLGLL